MISNIKCLGGFKDVLLSSLYIKLVDYIKCGGGEGISVLGMLVHILLYIDDIILVSKSHVRLLHYLDFIDVFPIH